MLVRVGPHAGLAIPSPTCRLANTAPRSVLFAGAARRTRVPTGDGTPTGPTAVPSVPKAAGIPHGRSTMPPSAPPLGMHGCGATGSRAREGLHRPDGTAETPPPMRPPNPETGFRGCSPGLPVWHPEFRDPHTRWIDAMQVGRVLMEAIKRLDRSPDFTFFLVVQCHQQKGREPVTVPGPGSSLGLLPFLVSVSPTGRRSDRMLGQVVVHIGGHHQASPHHRPVTRERTNVLVITGL